MDGEKQAGLGARDAPLIDIQGGISSAGRAPALQAGGRRFDPVILHQATKEKARQTDARLIKAFNIKAAW